MMRLILFFTVLVSISVSSFAQEEVGGGWFIEEFRFNGVQTEFGSFSTHRLGIITVTDNEGFVSGSRGCKSFSADISVLPDTMTFSDVSFSDSPCDYDDEEVFRDDYFEFMFGDLETPLNYEITGMGEEAKLRIFNAGGDEAIYGRLDILIPESLTQETWYLDSLEIAGETISYPPQQSEQLNDLSSTTFGNFDLEIAFTCYYGGSAIYSPYVRVGVGYLDVGGIGTLAMDCGSDILNDFDGTLETRLGQTIHSYEILEEGQGHRLTLTDENGNRIFFTNDFLAPKDKDLDGTWYFDYLELEDIGAVSPETALPYLIINSETETWQDNAACNSYSAHYIAIDNSLTLQNFGATDAVCATEEENSFENLYLAEFIGINEEISEFIYSVQNLGDGTRTLTINDTSSNSFAIYNSSHPNIPGILEENWVLISIENDGQAIDVSEDAYATLSIAIGPEFSDYFMEDNCAVYGGTMSFSDDTLSIAEFNESLDACMSGGEDPLIQEGAITNFYNVPDTQLFTYEILNADNIATRQLIITKENGDQAIYGVRFSEEFTSLFQEPWYLEYYEINGTAFNYPDPNDMQYEDFSITNFISDGTLQQQLTCWNPTNSTYDLFDSDEEPKIMINDLDVMIPNCGASAPFNFDNLFLGQLRNKNHSIEITEEGAGRRLTLTDENGDRIFYTNAFLSIDDTTTDNAISIYPNPVFEKLFIEASSFFAIKTIAIFNIQGQQIWQSDFRSEIDVSALSSGLYFVKFSDGNSESVHRFLKK